MLYRTQRATKRIAVCNPNRSPNWLPARRCGHRRIIPAQPTTQTSVPYLGTCRRTFCCGKGWTVRRPRGEACIAVIDTGIDHLHADFMDRPPARLAPPMPSSATCPAFRHQICGWLRLSAGDRYNADPDARLQPYSAAPTGPHGLLRPRHACGRDGCWLRRDGRFGSVQRPRQRRPTWGAAHWFPGVAPLAELYALKIFGCGQFGPVPLAMEWAVDPDGDGDFADRVDVINLSLGSNPTANSTTRPRPGRQCGATWRHRRGIGRQPGRRLLRHWAARPTPIAPSALRPSSTDR